MSRRIAVALVVLANVFASRAACAAHLRRAPRRVARPLQQVYSGREQRIHVAPPRLDEAGSAVDGLLTEPQWRQAALLTGFSEFAPMDGVPATDSTEVLVWYSSTAVHFGIRAIEAHGAPHATLASRDNIMADDQIHLLIDTFDDHQRALLFAVNPLGIQMDGVMNDGTPGQIALDMSPDYVFQSTGRLTADGYEVEIRIPFKSLKYQNADPQRWGFNVMRIVQHSGHEQSWTAARRGRSTLLGQSGTLDALTGLDRGLVLDVTPEVTQHSDGAPQPNGWHYAAGRPDVGGTVRYGVTNNLTLDVTAHPDFSQIESDAGNFNPDPRYALVLEEKRPFFLEGRESFARSFASDHTFIYSRRIVQPVAAAKLAGKVGTTSVGVLSAVDGVTGADAGETHPVYTMLRVMHELSTAKLGLTYADRATGAGFNRVGAVDARARFGNGYTAYAEVARSVTHDSTGSVAAPLWATGLEWAGESVQGNATFNGISPRFEAQSGWLERTGVVSALGSVTFLRRGRAGAPIELTSIRPSLEWNWGYDAFHQHGDALEKKAHLDAMVQLHGGWSLRSGLYLETFGFDPSLYQGYAVAEPAGAQPFAPAQRIGNIDKVLALRTPDWQRFSASGTYVWGNDDDFLEWAPATIVFASLHAEARPSEAIRVGASYLVQRNVRRSDGSVQMLNRIPRLKLEYQLARALSMRLVGEVDDFYHDALRDEGRTGAPLLVNSQPVGASQRSSLRGQALVSYQPTPGTVLFVGYGASYADEQTNTSIPLGPRALSQTALQRQQDVVFVKASYLLRL